MTAIDPMNIELERLEYPPLAGRPCIFQWNIAFQSQILVEVPTSVLAKSIPPGIFLVEPRPGVSLLALNFVHWAPGNFHGRWPKFNEVSVLAVVQSDLSYPMPVPKFSYFVLNIAADLRDFLKTEPRRLRLPTFLTELRSTIDDVHGHVDVSTERGPLLQFRSTMAPLQYQHANFVGQYFSMESGRLYCGFWQWEGWMCEHQRPGPAVELWNDPVFAGLDLGGTPRPYLQMFTRPGSNATQRFFEPIVLD